MKESSRMDDTPQAQGVTRRSMLGWLARGAIAACVALVAGRAVRRPSAAGSGTRMVWQLDPAKCTQCGRCATSCVLQPSAVKCVHAFAMCGYCKRCFGFFQPDSQQLDEAAENQLCPTDAIRRTYIEDPYFEYHIEEARCMGCALCVKGCGTFGNGSLFLQVRHDRCLNCNECRIAQACPAHAFMRVPADTPYFLKDSEHNPMPANRPAKAHV